MELENASPIRPVFVLGTGRCGSTLVHEVLAQHPGHGFITNLDDLGVVRSSHRQNALWRQLPPVATTKGRARFAPSEGYRALHREVGPLVIDPVRDLTASDATPWLQSRMRRFVDERAHRLGAPVFLHKFTGWSRAGFLDACFPDALFIEVVRDGRAVANSWLQMDWWRGHRGPTEWHFGPLPGELQSLWEEHGRSFPVLAALGWRILMESYRDVRADYPSDRWLSVRYEDIVRQPRDEFARMLEFLGSDWVRPFDTAFAKYDFGASRAAAYRRDLSGDDVDQMEAVLGGLLGSLGYDAD